jgi:SpoVK/Ycf46/Vps4 family AAA+-type ATPase
VEFLARLPQYQAYGLPVKRGVLLAGAPGTGKTLLGKVLCCTQAATFLWVSPGEVDGPEELQRIFALARECQPTILFLEDLDLYASHRGGAQDALLGELLNQLDGFPANTGILTLATTNDPKAIEPALGERPSRFDTTIRFLPPGLPERERLLTRLLRDLPHPPGAVAETARVTEGYTGAHLQAVVHRAVQQALEGTPATARDVIPLTAVVALQKA